MKFIHPLPWRLVTDANTPDEHELDAALYAVDESGFKCEFQHEVGPRFISPLCHPAPFSIGTSDEREPKFCFTHYFEINNSTVKAATGGMYAIVPMPV